MISAKWLILLITKSLVNSFSAFSCADLMTVTACNLMAALTAFCVKVKVADQNFAGSYRRLITGFFARNFRTPVSKLASQKFL